MPPRLWALLDVSPHHPSAKFWFCIPEALLGWCHAGKSYLNSRQLALIFPATVLATVLVMYKLRYYSVVENSSSVKFGYFVIVKSGRETTRRLWRSKPLKRGEKKLWPRLTDSCFWNKFTGQCTALFVCQILKLTLPV